MDATVRGAIRALLTQERVLAAAVLVDGEPLAALLPFAVSSDYRAAYVQASALARHARGLQEGADVGVLVHAPVTPDRDPMQVPRLTLQARVHVLDRGSDAFADAAARYIERFPAANTTLALGDFTLYALAFERGRYVEGFARAFNVGPDTFAELAENAI